jgi:DNA repair exonuclease SbcCD ATPase subunit
MPLSKTDTYELHLQTCLLTSSIANLEQRNTDLTLENAQLKAALRARDVIESTALGAACSSPERRSVAGSGKPITTAVEALQKEIEGRIHAETLLEELRSSIDAGDVKLGDPAATPQVDFYRKIHERNGEVEREMSKQKKEFLGMKQQLRDITASWKEAHTEKEKLLAQVKSLRAREKEKDAAMEREVRAREACLARMKKLEKEHADEVKRAKVAEKAWKEQHDVDQKELQRMRHVFSVARDKFSNGAATLKKRIEVLENAAKRKVN